MMPMTQHSKNSSGPPSMTVRELKSILSKADDTIPVVIYDPESGSNFPITQIGRSLENGSLALGYSEWI